MSRKDRSILIQNEGARYFDNGVKKSLGIIGKMIKTATAKGINEGPKTGRRYGAHQASKGDSEYPANKTGNLRRSLNYRVSSHKRMVIGMKANYAPFLEEGTTKMQRRKMLFFTIAKHRNKIRDIFMKNVHGELK